MIMYKKKIRNWLFVSIFGIVTILAVLLTTHNINVWAVSLSDADTARNSTAVKILAKNLSDCYKNAKQNVDFSMNNAWKYGSSVYWNDTNLQVNYPKILAGKTGNEASSTCANMITGWKTNWLVKLFTDRGDFVGVDQNVAIPGDWDNEEVFWDNTNAMKTYLTGVGYKKESASSSALSGYNCLYFHLDAYKQVFRDTKNQIVGGLFPAPVKAYDASGKLAGPFKFISRETYCVPLKDDGTHIDFSKELKVYLEEDDLGNGLDRKESSRDKLSLDWMYGNDFRVDKFEDDYDFVTTINEIYGYYQIYDGFTGEKRWVDEVQDGYLKVANNDSNSKCYNRFRYKSWFLGSWNDFCSVSDDAASIDAMNLTFDQFKNRFAEYLRGITVEDYAGLESSSYQLFSSVTPQVLSADKATAKFTKGAEADFVNYFFDKSGKDIVKGGYALDTTEQYMFYYDHLKDYFGKGLTTYLYDNKDDAADSIEVIWLNEGSGKFEKKYISMGSDTSKKACALTGDNAWDGSCSTPHDWVYFAEKLGNFTEDELNAAFTDIKPLDEDYEEAVKEQEGIDSETDICYSNSGAIGWIICPIVTAASGIGEHMWNQIEEYHMKIPASEVFKDGGGVQQAWGIVRNISNTAFVILLLVVIFSQLTGIGIDNYGIKRILPRLIVVAVLVNLSYIICEIAVDLSNIFGISLNSMLSGLADGLEINIPDTSGVAKVTGWTVDIALAGGGIFLFELLSTGSLLGAVAAIGLAILGIVIVVVVAMLTLYLILVAREAGIVLAIIISPIALVCYALPNTEKIFKKWVDLSKALLLVYPICGALIGAGKLAGAVLASMNLNSMKVAAMVVQVLPFFLVPTVLKSSLALMGNVGAKLSGLGRSIGRRGSGALQQGVRNSDRFKDWSQFQRDNTMARRAQRTQARLEGLSSRRQLTAREQDRLRKAQDISLEHRKRQLENQVRSRAGYATAMANKQDLSIEAEADAIARLNDPTILASERQSLADEARIKRSKARTALLMSQYGGEGLTQLQARWNTAFDTNNTEDLDALTNVITQRYGAAGANSIANRLSTIRGVAGNTNYQNSLRTLQRTMNDNSAFAGFMRSKSPDAYQMVSDAGMRDDGHGGMVYDDMQWFTQNNNTATAAKDWATASTATLQRAVDNNALSERMITDLLTSDDPAIKSGIQSEDGKRQVLEAALYNMQHNPSGMGPNLPNATAAANYEREIQQQLTENELYITHEDDALRRGQTTITIAPGTTFNGYATPAGFNTGGSAPVADAHGDYIYTDATTGRKWNASTGKYVR